MEIVKSLFDHWLDDRHHNKKH
ncbi:hypothetical protein L2023_07200 [Lactobacillus gasseri]|nr:hypothetical protein [Lactobacillus gasseri]MCZ3582219.1 hypothetical protein [Lactobacillus gasseri]MCZ3584006.1 hypothetical protein [Lactobacillus gasseri]MCZ3587618.1 hypothetical protein [Lactobacillus gasseri]MCZ3593360.1 hypothetical protein [Lactobacillus gasseri]